MKKFYTIEDFFPAEGDQRFSLTETSPLDSVSYTVFTADDFADAALMDYGERKIYIPETDTPLSTFYGRFARWKSQRGKDIAAAFGALRTAYKPLENYSMEEKKTGTETGLKTPSNYTETMTHAVSQDYKVTDTEKPTNWKETKEFKASNDYKETDTQRPTSWEKTNETIGNDLDNATGAENKIIPFNASDYANVSKTVTVNTHREKESQTGTYAVEHTQDGSRTEEIENTGTYAHEHTQDGTSTDTKVMSGTLEDKMTYNTTLTRGGNIGVTTSQQMAASELDLRMRHFVQEVLREFFDFVSVYA